MLGIGGNEVTKEGEEKNEMSPKALRERVQVCMAGSIVVTLKNGAGAGIEQPGSHFEKHVMG
jgi:hypothetical protein